MKALLLINGQAPKEKIDTHKFHAIYCTDGAYDKALSIGLKPDVVVGDFDSINTINLKNVEVLHRPNQDFTDFDKCLQVLQNRQYTSIDVYGATGLEHDHFLGNLTTALHFKDQMRITFHDDFSVFFFAPKHTQLHSVHNKTISLYPFPQTQGITSQGLRYPLKNMDLSMTGRVGTRNHAIEDHVEITYKKGNMLLFVSKNKKEKTNQ